jgi:hypothetical protein
VLVENTNIGGHLQAFILQTPHQYWCFIYSKIQL